MPGGGYLLFNVPLSDVLYVRYILTGSLGGTFEAVLYPKHDELNPGAHFPKKRAGFVS